VRKSCKKYQFFPAGLASTLSPSAAASTAATSRDSIDPIAELLSQLSGVRRSAPSSRCQFCPISFVNASVVAVNSIQSRRIGSSSRFDTSFWPSLKDKILNLTKKLQLCFKSNIFSVSKIPKFWGRCFYNYFWRKNRRFPFKTDVMFMFWE
jgi:hypothetical protein